MVDFLSLLSWLQHFSLTILLSLSILWLSFTLVDMLVGGTVPAIFSAYVRLPWFALRKKALTPISQNFTVSLNFIILFAYLMAVIFGLTSGFLDSTLIVKFFPSPVFLIFWTLCSVGLSLQAGVPAKTGAVMSAVAGITAFFITVPALVATILIPEAGRENFVFWAFVIGTGLGVAASVYANIVVLPNRYLEMSILKRDNSIAGRLQPLQKVLTTIRSFPRFIRSRREITYLLELREDALKALRQGNYELALSKFEIIDYEYPRISNRLENKIRGEFKLEIDEQLGDLGKRARQLSRGLSDGNLLEAIRAVELDIDALSKDSEPETGWDFEAVFQGKADAFSGVVTRLDRLTAIAEAVDANSVMTAWDFDSGSVQETIAVANALNVDSSDLKVVADQFRLQSQSIQELQYESYAELRAAMEATENLVEQSKAEQSKLSTSLAERYSFENFENDITVIYPRHVKKDEEAKIAVLVRGLKDPSLVDTIEVNYSSSGFSFLEGDRTSLLDEGDFALIETIFKSSSKKRNTFRTTLSIGTNQRVEHTSVHSIYVVPPAIELFSESGVIAAGVTTISALALYCIKIVSDLAFQQSTIGAISALCGCMYLLYSIFKIRMERNSG